MEFCGVFYETGYLRAVYDRIRKLFFVFLMAAVLTVGMMGQGMETINFGRKIWQEELSPNMRRE